MLGWTLSKEVPVPWFFQPNKPHRGPRPRYTPPRTGSPVCAGQQGHFHRHCHTKRRGNGIPDGSNMLHALFVCPLCGGRHWRYPA